MSEFFGAIDNSILIAIASALVGLIVIFLAFGVKRTLNKEGGLDDFSERLRNMGISEFDTGKEEEKLNSWNAKWHDLYVKSGKETEDPRAPGRLVLVLSLAGIGFGALVWPGGVVGGLFAGAGIIGGYYSLLNLNASKRIKQIDKQLPILLSHLRSNLQSGSTPQQAVVDVVADIPYPLGKELKVMKAQIEANVSLGESLEDLSNRIPSREMKFLTSSIQLAVQSGSDLDPQLEIIQDLMSKRTRQAQLLATAVASVTPTVWVAGIIIPLSFLFSLYSSPENKEYWGTPAGMGFAVIIVLLYVAGLGLSRKMVKNVENT